MHVFPYRSPENTFEIFSFHYCRKLSHEAQEMLKKAIYPRNLHCRSLPMGSINQRLESNALQMLRPLILQFNCPRWTNKHVVCKEIILKYAFLSPPVHIAWWAYVCCFPSVVCLYVTKMKEKYSNPAYQHSYFCKEMLRPLLLCLCF